MLFDFLLNVAKVIQKIGISKHIATKKCCYSLKLTKINQYRWSNDIYWHLSN